MMAPVAGFQTAAGSGGLLRGLLRSLLRGFHSQLSAHMVCPTVNTGACGPRVRHYAFTAHSSQRCW